MVQPAILSLNRIGTDNRRNANGRRSEPKRMMGYRPHVGVLSQSYAPAAPPRSPRVDSHRDRPFPLPSRPDSHRREFLWRLGLAARRKLYPHHRPLSLLVPGRLPSHHLPRHQSNRDRCLCAAGRIALPLLRISQPASSPDRPSHSPLVPRPTAHCLEPGGR